MKEPVNIKLDSKLGKLIRSVIYKYFNSTEESYSNNVLYTIANITITRLDLNYTVIIESYRPGLIIGKGGETIDELQELIQSDVFDIFEGIGISYKFNLVECTLWNKMY